jgi:hypothetical protein
MPNTAPTQPARDAIIAEAIATALAASRQARKARKAARRAAAESQRASGRQITESALAPATPLTDLHLLPDDTLHEIAGITFGRGRELGMTSPFWQ